MLTQEQAVEIKVLAHRGVPIREIARQLGVHVIPSSDI
jgi:IS30 family transposase